MTTWKSLLTGRLEPILHARDAARQLCAKSGYHDVPFAIHVYPPEAEFELRREVTLLRTRLEQAGKRVTTVSLAECLADALEAEGLGMSGLAEAERESGLRLAIETAFSILSELQPLDRLVASRIPSDATAERDVVLLVRAGAIYPLYRTSALLDQLRGKVSIASVLFYPGVTQGPAGLRAMSIADADHNYRPWIVE